MDPSIYPDTPKIEITTAGITKFLSDLDPSKSPGPNNIPEMLLYLRSFTSIFYFPPVSK